MSPDITGLLILAALLGTLLILQRLSQRETQAIFLLLTRRADIAVALFSLLFLPGVILHEASHFVMAKLLRVRTGRVSLLPRALPNGRLQLGFVETASTDWLRDALIGSAPLFLGGAFVAYAGLTRLGLPLMWEKLVSVGPSAAFDALPTLFDQPDFWLWFYLVFTVSSTMLPSQSDRRAWLPLALTAGLLLGLSLLAGAGPWLLLHLAEPLNRALQAVSAILGISVFIHLVLLVPLVFLHAFISRLTGLQVVG